MTRTNGPRRAAVALLIAAAMLSASQIANAHGVTHFSPADGIEHSVHRNARAAALN
ncbi:hypothetical protein [Nocardia lijiangensis]|uniref:hypothetical protein n=1 Tax=Nocardia lijiangensis TaxID=299618 RepID=UPI003D760058